MRSSLVMRGFPLFAATRARPYGHACGVPARYAYPIGSRAEPDNAPCINGFWLSRSTISHGNVSIDTHASLSRVQRGNSLGSGKMASGRDVAMFMWNSRRSFLGGAAGLAALAFRP